MLHFIKSPLAPLCQRGELIKEGDIPISPLDRGESPPLKKGDEGGFCNFIYYVPKNRDRDSLKFPLP